MSSDIRRPPSLLALTSYLSGHVSRIAHGSLVLALKAEGLHLPHFAVLAALADFGPLPQHELADHLGLNRSHLVGYLDDLEQRGLVTRARDPRDRRRQRVTLEDAGATLFAELAETAQGSEARHLDVLTPAERGVLNDLLCRVVVAEDRDRAPA